MGIARYRRPRGVMRTISLLEVISLAVLVQRDGLVAVVGLIGIDDHGVPRADRDHDQRIADRGGLAESRLAAEAGAGECLTAAQRGAQRGRAEDARLLDAGLL